MDKKKVLVGMSGGVDSSAAAVILQEAGYEVYGATMRLLPIDDKEPVDDSAEKDAKKVCDKLGIKHYVFDFRKEFKQYVVEYFVNEYLGGRTPNPCIACNKYLKFGLMLKKADELGIDYIATGHYAKIEKNDEGYILRASDFEDKDQSYVLYNMTKEQLSRVLMPLANYKKEEIRQKCRSLGLDIADKAESMDICFVRDTNYQKFIMDYKNITPKGGDIVDIKGNVIGRHNGLINYTIGQRKGLGAYGKPMFVLRLDIKNNRLILGEKGMEFSKGLLACDVNFIEDVPKNQEFRTTAKLRYKAEKAPCTVIYKHDLAEVRFDTPQRAITPGQSVVFYDGDRVLGGAIVSEIIE